LADKKTAICFDLKHSTTHLGDRLFLIDLIYSIAQSKYQLSFKRDDALSISLFNALGISEHKLQQKDILHISVKPMYLYLLLKHQLKNHIFIDNSSYTGPLAREIAKDFCSRLNIDYYEYAPKKNYHKNEQYVLLSNYIESGWFRKFFSNETVLYEKCLELRNEGFKIAHVGSAKDKECDQRHYSFIDVDWRGETAIEDIVHLFRQNKVAAVITYDNFFLHLGNLFHVPTYVLFRGRFSKKELNFHYDTVNVALQRGSNEMEYLE
jgi:hypothetical protein